MPTVFRITSRAGGSIGDADTVDEVLELAKGASPGRYRIDKFYFDTATEDVRPWKWGTVTKDRRGAIKLELPPWIG